MCGKRKLLFASINLQLGFRVPSVPEKDDQVVLAKSVEMLTWNVLVILDVEYSTSTAPVDFLGPRTQNTHHRRADD